jgi:Flp pilus assembly protein TadD
VQYLRRWLQRPFFIGILLALLATTAYLRVLDAPFIWDDEVMVVGNGLIRSLDNIPAILTTSPFGQKLTASEFYRPFQTLSYAFDYSIWQLNPLGYRLTNLALHILAVWIVFSLVGRLGYSRWVAVGTAAIIAVHPINMEAVSYVSGRGDALYFLVCLAIFRAMLSLNRRRWWWIPILIVFYAVALLTKENAVPFGLLMIGYFLILKGPQSNRLQKSVAGVLGGMSLAYAGMRAYFIADQGNRILSWIAATDLSGRLMTIPYCIWTYVRLAFVPYPLHMEYHYVETTWMTPYLWIAMPVIAALGYAVWRFSTNRNQTLFFLIWFLLCFGPVLQLVPLAATVREHWASLAFVGLWIAVVSVTYEGCRRYPNIWAVGMGIFVAGLWGATVIRNGDWSDPLTLYQHDSELEPRSFLLHNNVGVELYRQRDFAGAKLAFEKANEFSPAPEGYGTSLNNLGVIHENLGDLQMAEDLFRKSIKASQYELAYTNLARLLLKRGDAVQAGVCVSDGLTIYPYNGMLHLYWVAALFAQNRRDDAEMAAQKLLVLYPEYSRQVTMLRGSGLPQK